MPTTLSLTGARILAFILARRTPPQAVSAPNLSTANALEIEGLDLTGYADPSVQPAFTPGGVVAAVKPDVLAALLAALVAQAPQAGLILPADIATWQASLVQRPGVAPFLKLSRPSARAIARAAAFTFAAR